MPKRKREDTKDKGNATLKETTEREAKTAPNGFKPFTVTSKGKSIPCERRGPDAKPALIFTHGAGGGLSNAATKDFADGFAEVSSVVSFKGSMNLQGRINSFQAVVDHEDTKPALGGRSMGARAAVLVASEPESGIEAVILASFPMLGAQKGDSREQILLDLPENVDVLFIVGSNDAMCDMEHLQRVIRKMKARSWVAEVEGADHGMSIKAKAGEQPVRKFQGTLAAKWLAERNESKRYCLLSWHDGNVESTGWQDTLKESEGEPSSAPRLAKPRRKVKGR